jgi:benzoyl-CoA reductase subunit D
MIQVGIDVGAKFIKALVIKDGNVIAKEQVSTGFESKENAAKLFEHVLQKTGISRDEVNSITSTGSGRKVVDFATKSITNVTAASKGTTSLYPEVKTVIDVGAEEGRSIRCNADGKIVDFAINEKCAAGAGSFTEAMARALEIPLEEFGVLSLKSDKEIPMNAQCAVFAESEVVSLLHAKTPKEDIAKAINDAVASRITSMVRKVGFEKEIALIGGVAYNTGFVNSLETDLQAKIIIPDDPEYVGAYGAALITN